jgi:hypothetical protein
MMAYQETTKTGHNPPFYVGSKSNKRQLHPLSIRTENAFAAHRRHRSRTLMHAVQAEWIVTHKVANMRGSIVCVLTPKKKKIDDEKPDQTEENKFKSERPLMQPSLFLWDF